MTEDGNVRNLNQNNVFLHPHLYNNFCVTGSQKLFSFLDLFSVFLILFFRSTERRKERCRNAARVRRTKEADIFTEIEQSIPLSRQQLQQLDKISVMRVFTNTLKLRILFKTLSKFSYEYFVTQRTKQITSFCIIFQIFGRNFWPIREGKRRKHANSEGFPLITLTVGVFFSLLESWCLLNFSWKAVTSAHEYSHEKKRYTPMKKKI